MTLEPLEHLWQPYFHQLESGYELQPADIVKTCRHRQCTRRPAQDRFSFHELPTLFEVEDEFRATQSGKSTGFDNISSDVYHQAAVPLASLHYGLTLKSLVWQHEPVCSKGGLLTVIPKRLRASLPGHFRGIMLLPSYAKRIHALLRKRYMVFLDRARAPGQMGGMPHQQVQFANRCELFVPLCTLQATPQE